MLLGSAALAQQENNNSDSTHKMLQPVNTTASKATGSPAISSTA
jgi:hypothetical protein